MRRTSKAKAIDAAKRAASGWDTAPHSFTEQKTFTDGRILLAGNKAHRGVQRWLVLDLALPPQPLQKFIAQKMARHDRIEWLNDSHRFRWLSRFMQKIYS